MSRRDKHTAFLRGLAVEVKRRVPEIRLVAVAGSYTREEESLGDIDILVIIADDGQKPEQIFETYKKFYHLLRDMCLRYEVLIASFNITKELSAEICAHLSKSIEQVHILSYPTPRAFTAGENPWVVKGICSAAIKNVLHGEEKTLHDILNSIKHKLDLENLYLFLLQRLTYSTVILPGDIDCAKPISKFEMRMMRYCLKHLTKIIDTIKEEERRESLKQEVNEVFNWISQCISNECEVAILRERILELFKVVATQTGLKI